MQPVLTPPAAAAFDALPLALAVGASGANRAVLFEFAVGAVAAKDAIALALAVLACTTYRANIFDLAVGARAANDASLLQLVMWATLTAPRLVWEGNGRLHAVVVA